MAVTTALARMTRLARGMRYAAASLVAVLLVAGTVGLAPAAPAWAAATVPYTDKAATGYVTLYDKAGRPIKGGNVHDKPFVWKAVASAPAPKPYDVTGAKATLAAYQPQQGQAPTAWSGDTLTASTDFTDVAHPTATATAADFSLQDFLDEFPPRWDGLVQLRIFLGAPRTTTLTSAYATTDIRITGQTWAVVGGGPGAGAGGANIPGTAGPGAAGSSGKGSDAGTGAGTGTDAVNTSDDSPLAAVLPIVKAPATLGIAAAVVVALVLGGLFWRRRRTPASDGSPSSERPPA